MGDAIKTGPLRSGERASWRESARIPFAITNARACASRSNGQMRPSGLTGRTQRLHSCTACGLLLSAGKSLHCQIQDVRNCAGVAMSSTVPRGARAMHQSFTHRHVPSIREGAGCDNLDSFEHSQNVSLSNG